MIVLMQPLMVIARQSAFCISLRKICFSRKALSTNSRLVSSVVPGSLRYASARCLRQLDGGLVRPGGLDQLAQLRRRKRSGCRA